MKPETFVGQDAVYKDCMEEWHINLHSRMKANQTANRGQMQAGSL